MSYVSQAVRAKSMKRPSLLSTPLRSAQRGDKRKTQGQAQKANHRKPRAPSVPREKRPPRPSRDTPRQSRVVQEEEPSAAARRPMPSSRQSALLDAVEREIHTRQSSRGGGDSRRPASRIPAPRGSTPAHKNTLSEYQRRKRRENRHKESLYNTTKIRISDEQARAEQAAARQVYEGTKYRKLEVIDALYKARLERPQTRTGIVPDEVVVNEEITRQSKKEAKDVFYKNRNKSHDTVVKGIIFQQPMDSEGKPREPTPHDTIRKVGTPQTRSVPKVFLKGENTQDDLRRAYDETREIGDKIRNVMVEGNHVNRILAQEGKRVNTPRTSARLNTPTTRSLLKDQELDFEEAARNRKDQTDFYLKNKEWQLRSDVPDIFKAMRTKDTDVGRLVATPANSRKHLNTPTSRSIPRAFYRGAASTQEMIEANNESHREYIANKNLHFAARLPMLFPDEKPQMEPRGLTPAHARAHVNTPFTRGVPKVFRTDQVITPHKLKKEVLDTRDAFKQNKDKHSGADLSYLFQWESSPVSSPEPY
eukprot:TRINITY_DN583_c1_g3_i1.p1 TRINITY_DN583_c1_g3~~TRINITY_DN583_c1_g3_i1.p1  ORF type:complete len:534 (-),score=91.30 TRINITY_DN583_c1_g3_i1:474-2075(-)